MGSGWSFSEAVLPQATALNSNENQAASDGHSHRVNLYQKQKTDGNDDAMRAIEVILNHLSEACELGVKARKAAPQKDQEEAAPRRRSQRATMGRADDETGRPAELSEGDAGEEVPGDLSRAPASEPEPTT